MPVQVVASVSCISTSSASSTFRILLIGDPSDWISDQSTCESLRKNLGESSHFVSSSPQPLITVGGGVAEEEKKKIMTRKQQNSPSHFERLANVCSITGKVSCRLVTYTAFGPPRKNIWHFHQQKIIISDQRWSFPGSKGVFLHLVTRKRQEGRLLRCARQEWL